MSPTVHSLVHAGHSVVVVKEKEKENGVVAGEPRTGAGAGALVEEDAVVEDHPGVYEVKRRGNGELLFFVCVSPGLCLYFGRWWWVTSCMYIYIT